MNSFTIYMIFGLVVSLLLPQPREAIRRVRDDQELSILQLFIGIFFVLLVFPLFLLAKIISVLKYLRNNKKDLDKTDNG